VRLEAGVDGLAPNCWKVIAGSAEEDNFVEFPYVTAASPAATEKPIPTGTNVDPL
jgi:hypothetical protein